MDVAFVISSVVVFTGVILVLVVGLEAISNKLNPGGTVKININDGHKVLEVEPGANLLNVLANEGLFLPSACGGGGTCAMCTCKIFEGGGDILPTETGHIKKKEAALGTRLACQVKVKENMTIEVEEDVLEIKKFEATVDSNGNVATFIKELDMLLPPGMDLNHKSGGYIQIDIPKYDLDFKEFDVEKEYHEDWDKFNIWNYKAKNDDECFRAYSMANHPAEGNRVTLNVRIATPPPKTDFPPGIASSYIFNLKKGDKVMLSGPYGEFFIKETDSEMVYIGGGAGMAPLRSHIFHLFHTLKTGRKVSYWYGARSKREIFYEEEFRAIEKQFPNFSFHIALSDALPEDNWTGFTGFIHEVARNEYLIKHEDPAEIEYYLCGPPMMLNAVRGMLDDLGVEPEMIAYDEF